MAQGGGGGGRSQGSASPPARPPLASARPQPFPCPVRQAQPPTPSHSPLPLSPPRRQFLISWVAVLESVPDLDLLAYLPELLDGLLNLLSDPNR